jgi:hypothetical protein
MSLFRVSVGVGLVGVLFAVMYLVWVNWSGDMWPRLISAFGGGAITLMVAVLARPTAEMLGFLPQLRESLYPCQVESTSYIYYRRSNSRNSHLTSGHR